MAEKRIDEATGTETTGHVWDNDLEELNKPLPKWWLWVMYASIVWSVGYWVLYPAWPLASDYTKGVMGYSQRSVVMDQVRAGKEAQSELRKAIAETELTEIPNISELLSFATAGGKAAFGDNCAACHGRGAEGSQGYPNLNDDDWIWGGDLEAIHHTIQHGIRNANEDSRQMAMPRFGKDELLEKEQISQVADYVLSLSGSASADETTLAAGKEIFVENCASCHGDDGKGNVEMGAPNLADAIWLYGGDHADVVTSINTGRGGVMPPWQPRLDEVTIKQLAVYVHSLGGGQKSASAE